MPEEKPLTKSELLTALKEACVATKADLENLRSELKTEIKEGVDAVVTALEAYAEGEVVREGFKQVNSGLDKVGAEIHELKDEVKGLKEELSVTATKAEVRELREEVETLRSS